MGNRRSSLELSKQDEHDFDPVSGRRKFPEAPAQQAPFGDRSLFVFSRSTANTVRRNRLTQVLARWPGSHDPIPMVRAAPRRKKLLHRRREARVLNTSSFSSHSPAGDIDA